MSLVHQVDPAKVFPGAVRARPWVALCNPLLHLKVRGNLVDLVFWSRAGRGCYDVVLASIGLSAFEEPYEVLVGSLSSL